MTKSGTHTKSPDRPDASKTRVPDIAARLRELRVGTGLTLRDVADASGISLSQISKLETGNARLTVDLALHLAGVLRVPANAFFLEAGADPSPSRPVVTRANEGVHHRLKGMDFEVLCRDATEKRALNWRVTFHGKTLEACGGMRSHAGEEFLHILAGRLVMYFADDKTLVLNPGDSLVFDGVSQHGYSAPNGPTLAIMTNSVIG